MQQDVLTPHISRGNSKIGRVPNYSRLPILGCTHNCKACMNACYAVKHANRFPLTMEAWAENEAILRRCPADLYEAFDKALDGADAGRMHVAGDVTSIEQLDMMNRTAGRHADIPVWTYSTSYEILDEYLDGNKFAPNFSVMRSAGSIKEMGSNPHNMPLYIVVDSTDDIPNGAFVCPGHCDYCLKHKRGCTVGETTYQVKHR